MKSENIHPVFDRIVGRDEKEQLLNQNAKVLWFTGLSGSGKNNFGSSLRTRVEKTRFLDSSFGWGQYSHRDK